MAEILFTNFATSTIANVGGIASGDTSVDVQAGDGALFPNPSGGDYFYLTLIDSSGNREIVKCTARSTDTLTIDRGEDGTSARAFSADDKIELRLNAAALEAFAQVPSSAVTDNFATFDADDNLSDSGYSFVDEDDMSSDSAVKIPSQQSVKAFGDVRAPEYETIFIPAGAMTALVTDGADPGTYEYPTNDIIREYFAFDGTSDEYVGFSFPMPENWDRGTVKVKFWWAPGDSACTAGDIVTWEIAAGAKSNDDAIDAAVGTYVYVDDEVLAGKDGDDHWSDATGALTIGGTPALGDVVDFKVRRDADASGSGSDDMAEDAWLFGVLIQYKKAEKVTAW